MTAIWTTRGRRRSCSPSTGTSCPSASSTPGSAAQAAAHPTRLFTHREFAFTLPGDIYMRYNSFGTAEDFRREILRLNPERFEVGPVYSAKVRVAL